ncbi:MAG: glutamate-cysteine ligase family protein [Euzebya sp.]
MAVDPDLLSDIDDLRSIVADTLSSPRHRDADRREGGQEADAVGIEAEMFAIHVRDGAPAGRVSLDQLTGLLDDHPGLEAEPPSATQLTGWRVGDGARLMPEPGAQLEYAGPPCATAAAAAAQMSATIRDLATYADTRGVALIGTGLDPWHPAESVAQGLTCPRYPAMHRYLTRRSTHGHSMMTGSASIQVNLDLGGPEQAASRWATALEVAPLATAAFACSPTPGAVNGRAVVWQWLDPTRTGIPPAFVAGEDDPVTVITDFAMAADVLLVNRETVTHPGEPGFAFARWLSDGHPIHGRPTLADARYHLSTLFPEVRARGFLEIRSIDALPERWRMVPVVLYCGLLYDQRTREYVRALMHAHRTHLPELLRRAAHLGVADPQLCALAVEVWTAAAEGAHRLPSGFINIADISRAERFLDQFTLRGRSPSDELRERVAQGPAAALAWAREPVGSYTTC